MITDSHEGDLTVDDDVTITGMVIGIVRVTEHGSLDLRGTVSGGMDPRRRSARNAEDLLAADLREHTPSPAAHAVWIQLKAERQ